MGETKSHVLGTVSTEQLQIYIPYKYSFFRYIIVNTLHKSDNKDNNKEYLENIQ
jgi:hypothetical protein